jgi:hypothetical protein
MFNLNPSQSVAQNPIVCQEDPQIVVKSLLDLDKEKGEKVDESTPYVLHYDQVVWTLDNGTKVVAPNLSTHD